MTDTQKWRYTCWLIFGADAKIYADTSFFFIKIGANAKLMLNFVTICCILSLIIDAYRYIPYLQFWICSGVYHSWHTDVCCSYAKRLGVQRLSQGETYIRFGLCDYVAILHLQNIGEAGVSRLSNLLASYRRVATILVAKLYGIFVPYQDKPQGSLPLCC